MNPAQAAYQACRAIMTGVSLSLKFLGLVLDATSRWRAEGRFDEWRQMAKQRSHEVRSALDRVRDRS
ncbi:MAG: hypothetical protein OEW83_03390 [Acidimicrobiia bacterium]|nr:hypothetical protein [Acidimicrobiia bacterium]